MTDNPSLAEFLKHLADELSNAQEYELRRIEVRVTREGLMGKAAIGSLQTLTYNAPLVFPRSGGTCDVPQGETGSGGQTGYTT